MKYKSLGQMFWDLIPEYAHNSRRMFLFSFGWDADDAEFVKKLSATRFAKRKASYLIPGELERAKEVSSRGKAGASIRFGHVKEGNGFDGERRDYCLVGGVYKGRTLTVFYRRLDLLGGLFYDLSLFQEVERVLGPIRTISIVALQSDVFARQGGSNEQLYNKLRRYFKDERP